MKNYYILTCFFILVFSTTLFAQKDTIWYDANWNITNKNSSSYYRPAPEKKANGYWLVDYYLSGSKQMEALSLSIDEEKFEGQVTWFYENGNVLQTVNYKNGVLHGERKNYHESGPLKSQYSYSQGKIEGDWISFYENAIQNESGKYKNDERTGLWKEFHKNGKLKGEGNYKDGKKIGVWKMYYYDGVDEED